MKKKQAAAWLCTALLLAGMPATIHAEDTEVYQFEAFLVDGGTSGGHTPPTSPSKYQDTESILPGDESALAEQEEVDLDALAEEVFKLTNAEREKAGLPALLVDGQLSEMAMQRAKELEATFTHDRPDGSKCSTVFNEYETSLNWYGENIAYGQPTPERVISAWMNSQSHQKNLLRKKAEYLGIGVWQDSRGLLYWVQVFGKE
ncbi:CAP domain-containing protein [Anaerotruncus rubiinfantis]|uniref:CAP domain-containing protein n=1 Tax=Anaerotruncus rubiinfantis TaxID=1720200 RepID=UPI000836BDFA|nr:CAP domain-containing protein [Anaerotruncus rubiinfantis]